MASLLTLLAFSAAQILLGLYIARRVTGAKDFFVAGRALGPGLIFSTFLAANIGAGSTVGAAGLGYRDGLSAWWWVGSAGIGSLVLAWLVGPKIRAHRRRSTTCARSATSSNGATTGACARRITVLLWFARARRARRTARRALEAREHRRRLARLDRLRHWRRA